MGDGRARKPNYVTGESLLLTVDTEPLKCRVGVYGFEGQAAEEVVGADGLAEHRLRRLKAKRA